MARCGPCAVHALNRNSGFTAAVSGIGILTPTDLDAVNWVEYGARLGYSLTDTVTLDVYTNGVSGPSGIDTRVHTGAAPALQVLNPSKSRTWKARRAIFLRRFAHL